MKPERWQQITDIFQSALKRDPQERASLLNERCSGDPSLRREVEAMIASHDSAGSFIESPAYEVGAELLGDASAQARAGSTIGPYKIVSLLGAGGMGEVYLAEDARLGRRVALKLLHGGLARDSERVRRFQQEARAASALNHPNILSIYDTGTGEDGTPFVVSELLEGETLRERLAGGALPQRKAGDYALQIARGLSAAQSKGIIHRDLKPENLFVTTDGRVKILDFGIAKLTARRGTSAVEDEAPTMLVKTEPGLVIGTAGYMSPEQARGTEADHRSDIFSFGCVLYEMLSGRRAFEGNSAVEVLHAILKAEPLEITEAGARAAPALERIARRCLEKNPAERFQSASDLAFALEPLAGVSSASQAETAPVERVGKLAAGRRGRLMWRLVAGALFVVTAAALAFFASSYYSRVEPERNVVRLPVSIPEQANFHFQVEEHNLSVSPDGRHLAFVAAYEGRRMLWIRPLDALAPKILPGTDGASSPFWSPDGHWLAFFADGKLKRIESSGASLQTVCSLSGKRSAQGTWGSAGTIIFSQDEAGDFIVPAQGGPPAPLPNARSNLRAWFHFLPDGKRFIYYDFEEPSKDDDGGIYSGSIGSTDTRLILTTPPARPQYVRPGYLLYPREGSLLARPFDEQSLRLGGEAAIVVEALPYFDKTGWADYSASDNGVLIHLAEFPPSRLVWRERSGRELGQVGGTGDIANARLSPDGRSIALVVYNARVNAGGDLWIHDITRETRTLFASGPTDESNPVWSPDGLRLAYFSCCEAPSPLRIKELSDTGKGQTPLGPGFPHSPQDWSLDGRFILFRQRDTVTGRDVWVLPVSGEPAPYALLRTQHNEDDARLSPDGRWVAYVSDESGQQEVYVARFDSPGEKRRISTSGGAEPRWRRDGRELFYIAGDYMMMAVAVGMGGAFESGPPTPLFRTQAGPQIDYEVTADGQRFLVSSPEAVARSLRFIAVLDWAAMLKR